MFDRSRRAFDGFGAGLSGRWRASRLAA